MHTISFRAMAYPPYSLLVCRKNDIFIQGLTKALIIKVDDMHLQLFYDIIFTSVSWGHELD